MPKIVYRDTFTGSVVGRMRTSDSLYALAELVAAYEEAGYEVAELNPIERTPIDDRGVEATLVIERSICLDLLDDWNGTLELTDATITEEGTLQFGIDVRMSDDALDGAALNESTDQSERRSSTTTGPDGDGPTSSGSDTTSTDGEDAAGDENVGEEETGATVASADGTNDPVETETPTPDSNSEKPNDDGSELPAHRDPDRLREVYDEDRTFADMRDRLGVDVTPQTVRKHMVNHGIHEPSKHVTATENAASSEESEENEDRSSSVRTADPSGRTDGDSSSERSEVEAQEVDPSSDPSHTDDVPQNGDPGASTQDAQPNDSTPESASINSNSENGSGPVSREEDPSESERVPQNNDEGTESASDAPSVDDAIADQEPSPVGELEPMLDGIGIQDHLSMEDVIEAVHTKKTLFEVQRSLELERDEAKQLLEELDLLELVHGRLPDEGFDPTREEIEDRIRTATLENTPG